MHQQPLPSNQPSGALATVAKRNTSEQPLPPPTDTIPQLPTMVRRLCVCVCVCVCVWTTLYYIVIKQTPHLMLSLLITRKLSSLASFPGSPPCNNFESLETISRFLEFLCEYKVKGQIINNVIEYTQRERALEWGYNLTLTGNEQRLWFPAVPSLSPLQPPPPPPLPQLLPSQSGVVPVLESRVAGLEQQVWQSQRQVAGLQSSLEQSGARVAGLESEVGRMKSTVEKLLPQIYALQSRLSHLTTSPQVQCTSVDCTCTWENDCIGCAVLLSLVCLFELACFFLPSSSLQHVYIIHNIYNYIHLLSYYASYYTIQWCRQSSSAEVVE